MSGAEYPNKTLTLNVFLKYVKRRTNNAQTFPVLVGKLFVFADMRKLLGQGLGTID